MRFDAEQEKPATPPAPVDQISQQLFKARTIFVTGEITDELALKVVAQLHGLAAASDDPILMVISSPGGHVESGDMIHDAIKFVKPKVRVLGSGWVASAGALIYAAADKADRYSLPNTRFLLHQPSGGVRGSASDVEIQAREIGIMRKRLDQIFADATGQPIDRVSKDTDRDYWMSAQEAVDYGLVNKIIVRSDEIT
jgi:ATP-dependent Clp protease, protease subunit